MKKIVPVLLVIFCTGCVLTMDYLNPNGIGKARTVGNPCPYTYRVMEVRSERDPDLRIYVSAFWKGSYQLTYTTLFVVVTDNTIWGYQVGQDFSPPLNNPRHIEFPNGPEVTATLPGGEVLKGIPFNSRKNNSVIRNALILSLPISDSVLSEFSVRLPKIEIDGESFDRGEVVFTKSTES